MEITHAEVSKKEKLGDGVIAVRPGKVSSRLITAIPLPQNTPRKKVIVIMVRCGVQWERACRQRDCSGADSKSRHPDRTASA